MPLSIFGDKAIMPNENMLTGVLADTKVLWDQIRNHAAAVCGNGSEQWKFYSKKAGWSLVVKSGGRTILYLIPLEGYFKVNFVFGEKAVRAAKTGGLPAPVLALIEEAAPYMEGRSFMFDVKTQTDAETASKLIDIKHAH